MEEHAVCWADFSNLRFESCVIPEGSQTTDEWYNHENMEKRGVVQIPLCFLAKSLENMSLCHVAYFCKGWENARGCRIEHEAAKAYGLEIIYE